MAHIIRFLSKSDIFSYIRLLEQAVYFHSFRKILMSKTFSIFLFLQIQRKIIQKTLFRIEILGQSLTLLKMIHQNKKKNINSYSTNAFQLKQKIKINWYCSTKKNAYSKSFLFQIFFTKTIACTCYMRSQIFIHSIYNYRL